MRVLVGSAVLVALGATACGGGDGPTEAESLPYVGPASSKPPSSEAEPPLRRPKPNVALSVTPPPIKPPNSPADRLEPITVTGTLAEPDPGFLVVQADSGRWELAGSLPEGVGVGDRVQVAGRPAPEVGGSCGAPVIRVRDVRPL